MEFKYYANFYIGTNTPPIAPATWVEFTRFLVSGNTVLNQRVESENPGQAGAIVFDNIDLSFFYSPTYNPGGTANPVYDFFHDATYSADLDLYPRVVLRICASEFEITGGVQQPDTETQIFIGVIDFSSITYPVVRDENGEYVTTIHFTVVEKLSALNLLESALLQRTLSNYSSRLPVGTTSVGFFGGQGSVKPAFIWSKFNNVTYPDLLSLICFSMANGANVGGQAETFYLYDFPTVVQTETLVKVGEILRVPKASALDDMIVGGDGLPDVGTGAAIFRSVPGTIFVFDSALTNVAKDYDEYLVVSSWLDVAPASLDVNQRQCTFVRVVPLFFNDQVSSYMWNNNALPYLRMASLNETLYYSRDYYESGNYIEKTPLPIDVNSREYVGAYDALKILQSVLRSRWAGETLDVSQLKGPSPTYTPITEVELPIYYFSMTIDEYPMNQEALDGVIELVKGIKNTYLYTDTDGDFVLANKNAIDANTSYQTLPVESLKLMTKKHMWDKLVDSVKVYVKSWIRNSSDTDFIDGAATVSIRSGIKPRNEMPIDIIATSLDLAAYGITVNSEGNLVCEAQVPVVDYPDVDIRNGLILNYYAEQIAEECLLFYGVRRFSYDVPIARLENSITYPMLSWKMLNVFRFGAALTEYFFVTSMVKDLSNKSMTMEIVSRLGASSANNAAWKDNIVAVKSNDDYVSGSGGGGSDSGSVAVVSRSIGGNSIELVDVQDFMDNSYVQKRLRLEGSASILGGKVVQYIKRADAYNRFILGNFFDGVSEAFVILGSTDGLSYEIATNLAAFNFLTDVNLDGEGITTKIATDKSLELEIMKMNFQSVSWAQFAIFDSFDDTSKMNGASGFTYDVTVEKSRLTNGGDATASRIFGFKSKTYSNINRIFSGTSTGVGVNYLTDSTQNWFTNECKNLILVDSGANEFTVTENTSNTLTVSGTPLSGSYYLKTALPAYAIAFCSFEDSTEGGGNGFVKLEVSFDGGTSYQTFLDTENTINLLEGTVAITNPGSSYIARISLKNSAGGLGAIVYKFLICTDPPCWRF